MREPKSKLLQRAYAKAVKLYKAQVRRMQKRGYKVNTVLPPKPKKITEGSIRNVQRQQSKLYEEATYTTSEGEIISGRRAQRKLRKESAKKAVASRQLTPYEKEIRDSIKQYMKDIRKSREEGYKSSASDEYRKEVEEQAKRDAEETKEEREARLKRRKEYRQWEKNKRREEEKQQERLKTDVRYASQFGRAEIGKQWIQDTLQDVRHSGFTESANIIERVVNNALKELTEEFYNRKLDEILSTGKALTDSQMRELFDEARVDAEQAMYAGLTESGSAGQILALELTASAYRPEGARFNQACTQLYTALTGNVPSAQEMQTFSVANETDLGWTDIDE